MSECLRPFKARADAQRQVDAAVHAARVVVASDIAPRIKRHLLRLLPWFCSEAWSTGKYNLRFQSEAAAREPSVRNLVHEHVWPRKVLADRLLAGEDAAVVLADAVACVVTREEDRRLSRFKDLTGWDRYRAAGIRVLDTVTGAAHGLGDSPGEVTDPTNAAADRPLAEPGGGSGGGPVDRHYWETRASPRSLAVVDRAIALIQAHSGPARITYNKGQLALHTTGRDFCWFHPPKNGDHCRVDVRLGADGREGWIGRLKQAGIGAKLKEPEYIGLKLSERDLESHDALVPELLHACELASRGVSG